MGKKKCRICRQTLQDSVNSSVCPDCRDRLLKEIVTETTFESGIEKIKSTLVSLRYRVDTKKDDKNGTVLYRATWTDSTGSYADGDADQYDIYLKQIREHRKLLEKINAEISGEKRWIINCMCHTFFQNGYQLDIRMELRTTVEEYLKNPNNTLTVRDVLQLGDELCTYLSHRKTAHNNINLKHIFINPCFDLVENHADESTGSTLSHFFILEDIEFPYPKNEAAYNRAPELAVGVLPSVQTDIYAVGMTMYTLLNGINPGVFAVNDRAGIDLSKNGIFNNINNSITDVIKDAIALYPSERYQSLSEFQTAIQGLIEKLRKLDEIVITVPDHKKNFGEWLKEHLPKLDPKIMKKVACALAVVVLVAAIGGLVLHMFNQTDDAKIMQKIESGSYLVASQMIEESYQLGGNVNNCIIRYVDACIDDGDFKFALKPLPYFSDYENIPFYKTTFTNMVKSGGGKYVADVIDDLRGKNPGLDAFLDSFVYEYGDQLK